MSIQTVTAITVEFHDSAANSHKFYRAYYVGDIAVFQYGRIGAAGQWAADRYGSADHARAAANGKITEKENSRKDRYGGRRIVKFDYEVSRLNPDNKGTLLPLHQCALDAASAQDKAVRDEATPAPAAPVPAAPVAAKDRHGEFTARALAAVSMAVTDAPSALVELALLREQWEELQEIHERAASYLQTLNTMLLADTPA